MAATTTKLGIINRGLQLLGSQSISNINENSRGAKAMLRAYDAVLLSMLRANTWNFAIKRAHITADATQPIFGKSYQYTLPGDFLFLAPNETNYQNPDSRDWQIEGGKILTDDGGPLPVRYVSSSVTESDFDVLFAEGLSAGLAMATCEEITNSNTKKADAQNYFDSVIKEARKRNSIENAPRKAPTCSWIAARV